MKLSNNKSGVTLVELVLYIAILSFVVVVVSSFLSILIHSRIKNQTIAEVEQQGIQIMQILTQTIRNADSITRPSYGESSSELIINTSTPLNNPTIFDLVNSHLQITEGISPSVYLHNDLVEISDLIFSNTSLPGQNDIITIRFTLSRINTSGRNEYSYSKTFYNSATLR